MTSSPNVDFKHLLDSKLKIPTTLLKLTEVLGAELGPSKNSHIEDWF